MDEETDKSKSFLSLSKTLFLYCETLQAKLFARHHALCAIIAAGRTESLFYFTFFMSGAWQSCRNRSGHKRLT